ncbi:hypothetical protein BP5796_00462 [Coleophoma crateriformis]|uniref:SH3 domain-containing protein n=1 Tax=Coleophoma crateriformis TaxID=565419 RepID=A0A3D8T815_9HELO|nr:hypothetical protein BP5796_00462 [Coleophoma crateriformis]
MTRPEIIRADSIDLQNSNAPSAQDHTRQSSQPAGPPGNGPLAPHQADTLREVAAETAEEQLKSPRVSKEWSSGEMQQMQDYSHEDLTVGVTESLNGLSRQKQDTLAVAQNGGLTGSTAEDAEMAGAEGDDDMDDEDDDMMDKISSSPSIEDGGYSLPKIWPARMDSLSPEMTPLSPSTLTQACNESSSPFVETPDHYPLRLQHEQDKDVLQVGLARLSPNHHHSLGEYLDTSQISTSDEHDPAESPMLSLQPKEFVVPYVEDYDADYILDYRLDRTLALQSGLDLDIEGPDQGDSQPLTIPYQSSEEDDGSDDDFAYTSDSRFIDSGWGGECLQELEDIDFEFVYALHTFVATVEGQANATKGDTMVLLDDSNSYWWLVRVVKDSSIGYLPAEHIETPTERLARLNKHRNIDLTSTMLGDQAEKSKNPLKKAIRRRGAKTVAFAAPTYFEASDNEYSSEEEEDGEGEYYGQQDQQAATQETKAEDDDIVAVEPLKPRSELREAKSEPAAAEANRAEPTAKLSSDTTRSSDEFFEGKKENKSRNGTVRNTDSFFKDDTVETRKITLTPNLLRDDSSTSTRTSGDSKDAKQRPSLEKLEKDSVSEKSKDKKDKKEKKEKEKKPGMLSGLFKRKDKKSKAQDDEIEGSRPRSSEDARTSPVPSKDSEEAATIEETTQKEPQQVQRQTSKLQKVPRADTSPTKKQASASEQQLSDPALTTERAPAPESAPAPSMRLVQPEPDLVTEEIPVQPRELTPEPIKGLSPAPAPAASPPKEQKSGGTISKMLRSASSSNSESKPVKAKKAKSRVELDDFDSSADDSPVEELIRAPSKQTQRPIPGAFPDSYISIPTNDKSVTRPERLSESPVQVSPINSQSHPPALMVDTSSQEEVPSPVSSPSPELINADEAHEKKGPGSASTSASTSTWSDAHLRTFFDDDADIKDLLVVVYDKSGVVPAGPDHPITGDLFREENAKLADITNRLDEMLGDWLARKAKTSR